MRQSENCFGEIEKLQIIPLWKRWDDEKFEEAHDAEKSSRCANFEKLFQKISRNHNPTDVATR